MLCRIASSVRTEFEAQGAFARAGAGRVKPQRSRVRPASVKRAVWTRDRGCCAFEGAEGRCGERGFLEFHHVVPYADGGAATEENVQLRCRVHNQYEAETVFGHHERACQSGLPV